MKQRILASLLCLALALTALVCPALADSALEPPANGCVLDVAGVLESSTINHIVSQNKKLSNATGGAIVVVTVDFLNGKDIADYALEVFDDWGVGDKERNNGVLILLAIGEEDYYLLQGSGLQNALPSSTLGEYSWNYLENDFANENYDAGVRKLFDALYQWFEDHYASDFNAAGGTSTTPGVAAPPSQPQSDAVSRAGMWMLMVILVVVVLFVLVAILSARGPRRHRYYYSSGYYGRPRIFGWPRRPRAPRPPRPPRQPRPPRPSGGGFGSIGSSLGSGFGHGFGGSLGGGSSRGGGASRSSGPTHRSSGGGSRPSGGGRSLGGGSSRGGGAGRRR